MANNSYPIWGAVLLVFLGWLLGLLGPVIVDAIKKHSAREISAMRRFCGYSARGFTPSTMYLTRRSCLHSLSVPI